MNCIKDTGAHIRSILLGVIEFKNIPTPEKTTTPHIALWEKGFICSKIIFALERTMMDKNDIIKIFNNATTLILNGYFPG
jgi:hypothetical protein